MSAKLFVGGLAWGTDDMSLRTKFEEYGTVEDAIIMRDRDTGRSRGFGFVTFSNEQSANDAIQGLNDKDFEGRKIMVNKANNRGSNGGGGYSGGGGGGYNGGGGGGYNAPSYGQQQGGYGGYQ